MNSLVLLNGSPRGERSNSMKMLKRVAEGWVARRRRAAGSAAPGAARAVRACCGGVCRRRCGSAGHAALHGCDAGAGEGVHRSAGAARRSGACRAAQIRRWPFLCSRDFPRRRTRGHWSVISKSWRCGWIRTMQARLCAAAVSRCRPCRSRPTGSCGRGCKRWANSWRVMAVSARLSSKPLPAPERFSRFGVVLASLACRIPIIQFYWNGMLKKNGAWERRFAAPYGPAFEDKAGVSEGQEALSTAGPPPQETKVVLGDPGRETGATKTLVFWR